jgi:hypothetical protein
LGLDNVIIQGSLNSLDGLTLKNRCVFTINRYCCELKFSPLIFHLLHGIWEAVLFRCSIRNLFNFDLVLEKITLERVQILHVHFLDVWSFLQAQNVDDLFYVSLTQTRVAEGSNQRNMILQFHSFFIDFLGHKSRLWHWRVSLCFELGNKLSRHRSELSEILLDIVGHECLD